MKVLNTKKFDKIVKKMHIQLKLEIRLQIKKILRDPIANSRLSGDLSGFRANKFNLEGVSYRIAYVDPSLGSNKYFELPDEKTIIICYTGKRENFYRNFRRFLNLT